MIDLQIQDFHVRTQELTPLFWLKLLPLLVTTLIWLVPGLIGEPATPLHHLLVCLPATAPPVVRVIFALLCGVWCAGVPFHVPVYFLMNFLWSSKRPFICMRRLRCDVAWSMPLTLARCCLAPCSELAKSPKIDERKLDGATVLQTFPHYLPGRIRSGLLPVWLSSARFLAFVRRTHAWLCMWLCR